MRPLVPRDLQRLATLHRGPAAVGEHRHAAADRHDVAHAGDRSRGAGVEAGDLASEDGAARHGRIEHPGELHVDAVDSAAVHLGGSVGPRHRPADETELLRILQRRILRDLHRGGGGGQLPVTETPPRRRVEHRSFLRAAARRRDAPSSRGGGDQHRARGGARLAHRRELAPHRAAAAGLQPAELPVGPGLLDAHARPVGLQLVGHDHRQGRARALTHL